MRKRSGDVIVAIRSAWRYERERERKREGEEWMGEERREGDEDLLVPLLQRSNQQ